MFTAISKITETWEKFEEFGDEVEFLIKPLNGIEQLQIGDIVARTKNLGTFNSEVCIFACDVGLKGWRNLKDRGGNEIKFEENDVSVLSHGGIRAIAINILGKSEMSQIDKKK